MASQTVNAVDLLQQISKRAEDLTKKEQAESFVAIRRIDGALRNRDSRIIFGRRGTGKTHILSFVESQARSAGGLCCLLDMRTLGSNNSIYSNQNLSPQVRATTLIRDLLTAIHEKLLDAYTDPQSDLPKTFQAGLEKLSGCVRTVVVDEVVEKRVIVAETKTVSGSAAINAKANLTNSGMEFLLSGTASSGDAREKEVLSKGIPRLTVNMGETNRILNDLAEQSGCRIWERLINAFGGVEMVA